MKRPSDWTAADVQADKERKTEQDSQLHPIPGEGGRGSIALWSQGPCQIKFQLFDMITSSHMDLGDGRGQNLGSRPGQR